MSTEEWRDVVGYEGLYEVSSEGRVRSLPRNTTRGRVLRANPNSTGYLTVGLSRDGAVTKDQVHVLVAAAFHGPRPDGLDVCHNNGIPTDNRAANLRYDSRAQNVREGGAAVLNAIDAALIRMLRGRHSQRVIASAFGVRQPTVSKVQTRFVQPGRNVGAWHDAPDLDPALLLDVIDAVEKERRNNRG